MNGWCQNQKAKQKNYWLATLLDPNFSSDSENFFNNSFKGVNMCESWRKWFYSESVTQRVKKMEEKEIKIFKNGKNIRSDWISRECRKE